MHFQNYEEDFEGEKKLVEKDCLPILTKKQYKMTPSNYDIFRMSQKELENVEDFSIENEYGKIEYLEPVDLYKANLDEIFEISQGEVSVYGNNFFRPPKGEKFNKKATIYLYKMFPGEEESKKDFLEKLQKNCIQIGAEFRGYLPEKGIFIFNVEHF